MVQKDWVTWRAELTALAEAGIEIEPGLDERELERVESVVGAPLPPDLRSLLSEGLPFGDRFPNWREPDSEAIRGQLDWPFEGMAFDIEHDVFWLKEWGPRPPEAREAIELARAHVDAAPRLIPIRGHRYLPAEPSLAGNPVFSVYQTDIILYGDDLATYLRCEFHGLPYAEAVSDKARKIRFWGDLTS